MSIDNQEANSVESSSASSTDLTVDETEVLSDDAGEKPSPNYDHEFDRYVIQPISFGNRGYGFPSSLYYSALAGDVERSSDGLRLSKRARVGFNKYTNSFFAAYWAKYTTVRGISLTGVITGLAVLHLFRSSPSGKTIEVGSYPIGVAPGEQNIFHIHFKLFEYLPSEGGAGRYFFDIEAVSDLTIHRVAFCAFNKPARSPSLSIGICTFKKEDYISNIALTLDEYVRENPGFVSDVFLVNNDQDLSNLPVLKDLGSSNRKFHVVSQSNIGGAGGFARTLFESLKNSSSTHHVFMDDDIFLDPEILNRLWPFLAYAREDVIVGGHMMDMQNPWMLYEGGSKLDYWGFLQRVGSNIDATSHLDVTFFDDVMQVDYNAWWFACIPKEQAREVGLPLNIFIRGDDFEFGLRMKNKADVETVSLPGLYIWHEPFEGKTASWLEYYNWRNRFIICSLYASPEKLAIQPVDMLRDILVDHFESGNFEIAFVMCLAMLDFLSGPESILSQDAESLHGDLRKVLAELQRKPGSFADLLNRRLDLVELPQPEHSVIRLALSPRLGGRQRVPAEVSWIESEFLPAVDQVLSLYETHVDSVMAEWRSKAHDLSTEEAWASLYWE